MHIDLSDTLEMLEWDRPPPWLTGMHKAFTFGVFLLTVIILTNLLIAMMSERFSTTKKDAQAVWRVQFAGLVHEYFDANVMPLPLNVIEILVDRWYQTTTDEASHGWRGFNENSQESVWGRHYVWPLPTVRFDMHVARTQQEPKNNKPTDRQNIKSIQKQIHHATMSERDLAREMRATRRPMEFVQVDIIDHSMIETNSRGLAKELGVDSLWKAGVEENSISASTPVHVGKLEGPLEDEAALAEFCRSYGLVLAVTIRRKHTFSDKGVKKSWALVSFASEEAASKCIDADGVLVKGTRLKISKLDDRSTTSTGAMGETMARHNKKVNLLRRRGDIICETPGHSDEVGERCVAVRLHSDGRVILVRRSGVKEVDLPSKPDAAESGVNVARWGRGGVSVAKVRPKRLFTDEHAHASARFDGSPQILLRLRFPSAGTRQHFWRASDLSLGVRRKSSHPLSKIHGGSAPFALGAGVGMAHSVNTEERAPQGGGGGPPDFQGHGAGL